MQAHRAAAATAAAFLSAASAAAQSGGCDRACLEGLLDTYVEARRVESGPKIPWTWAIAEVFKIERGLIGPVESVIHPVPYGMGSGWSTWEESLSSEPRG